MTRKTPEPSTPLAADLSDFLERLGRRDESEPLPRMSLARPVVLDSPEAAAAAAIGLLMLERLCAKGGSRLAVRDVRSLREKVTEPFQSREVMQLEIEAYESLAWIAGLERSFDVAPEPSPTHTGALELPQELPILEVLRRGMADGFDLIIHYYTQSRGQLNRRQVTPRRIDAETYLHAFCHSRQQERVFRISRIAEIHPVLRKATAGAPPAPSSAKRPEPGQGQLDF